MPTRFESDAEKVDLILKRFKTCVSPGMKHWYYIDRASKVCQLVVGGTMFGIKAGGAGA